MRRGLRGHRTAAAVLLGLLALPAVAGAQRAPSAPEAVEADPLRCWWRTSAGAVRVGEPFTLTLTCAAIETDSTRVLVDRTRLDATVLALPPFDVTGGTPAADLTTAQRRFFQYSYTVRLISDLLFGQDAKIPPLTLSYKIENRSPETGTTQGRDQTYILPPLTVRVQTLVPGDAADIRDTTALSFAAVEGRRFRGRALSMGATALYGLALVLLGLAAARLVTALRAPARTVVNPVSDRTVVQAAGAEIGTVLGQARAGEWNEALATRARAALAVVAAYAAGRPVAQQLAAPGEDAQSGQLLVATRWPRSRRVRVSASVTPAQLTAALEAAPALAPRLAPLRDGLAALTAGQYGRRALDTAAAEAGLERGRALAGTLALELAAPVRRLRRLLRRGAGGHAPQDAAWER